MSAADEMSVMEVFAMALLVATELEIKLTGLAFDARTEEFCFATDTKWSVVVFLKTPTPAKVREYFNEEFLRVFRNQPLVVASPTSEGN